MRRGRVNNMLTSPPGLPLVAPSILSADFADLAADCRETIKAGADLLHLDVMDGHFVPNLTIGPALCASLRKAMPSVFLDVHLMVTNPERFVEAFAAAGADHFTFHVEAHDDPAGLAETIRATGMTAGLAVNPPTPIEQALPLLDAFDLILVMSVNPGFSGQAFIAEVLEKTRAVAERLDANQRLQMDGGINAGTTQQCRAAGCDVLVGGSSIFGSDDYAGAVACMRGVPGATDLAARRS